MTAIPVSATARPAGWWRGFSLLVRYEFAASRLWLPMAVVVQLLVGAGVAIMYGFYFGPDDVGDHALWITTGAPALALIPVGMVMVPNLVGEQRMRQTYDFMWTLPVPRSAAAMALFAVTPPSPCRAARSRSCSPRGATTSISHPRSPSSPPCC